MSETGSQAIAYHDTLAAGWTDATPAAASSGARIFLLREVLPKTRIAGEWIDVGCGSGVFSRILAGAGANVLGVDGSAPMIAAARAFAGAATHAPL